MCSWRWKRSWRQDICIAFYEDSPLKRSEWHVLRGITQFYLAFARLFTNGMSHPVFTPQPQRITALWPVLVSRPTEGRRLSWRGWLVTYRDGMPARRRFPFPVPTKSWLINVWDPAHTSNFVERIRSNVAFDNVASTLLLLWTWLEGDSAVWLCAAPTWRYCTTTNLFLRAIIWVRRFGCSRTTTSTSSQRWKRKITGLTVTHCVWLDLATADEWRYV